MVEPGGRLTSARMKPWSSSGTKPVGSFVYRNPVRITASTNTIIQRGAWRTARPTCPRYVWVNFSKDRSNQRKNAFLLVWCVGFRMAAHRDGVNDMARKAEKPIDTAMVNANCA